MKEMLDNIELSYEMQRESFTKTDEKAKRIQQTWLSEDTVDYWRHHRMMLPLKPILDYGKNDKWVTIGDGRLGLDSIRMKKIQPALDVLPTDISTMLLKQAKDEKLIADYQEQNAEQLTFTNGQFDFALCKESYHHFPRPYIALYEMLRVSKKAVVLVEPNDRRDKRVPERLVDVAKRTIKRIIGKPILHPETWNFEVSGNYIYTVSKNEIEKVCLGLQLPAVGFYYYNDYYEEGVEFQKAEPGNKVFQRVQKKIARDDRKCRLGLLTYQGIIAILFKESPDKTLKEGLEKSGFNIIDLPVNPYLKKRKESLLVPGKD